MSWIVLRLLALKTRLASRFKSISTQKAGVGIFAFVVFLLSVPLPVHAQSKLNLDLIAQTFAGIAFYVAQSITQLIILMIDVLIPIMLYNDFVTNPVVKSGWAILRDTVNMFFVVVLIIIAFGTIFGHSRFKWQQQVPRLLIFAVVINFSKTLCGIMIDFGQVIMLTFANALREIAAGNFIQLLGLNQIYQISESSSIITSVQDSGGAGAGKAFDFFASGLAAVAVTIMVLAVMVVMVAILLFRIVMLWILVALAPMAWFMGGVSSENGFIKSDAYAEWWKEFKCLVAVGPILTFFLWLTLAVAGSGSIATDSGFSVSGTSNSADFSIEIFQSTNFLSFLIGMALLLSGLKAAAQFCGTNLEFKSPSQRIGGLIGAAKSLPGTAAGISARYAGLGLRGAPAAYRRGRQAASDASRYLPPVVSNLPANVADAARRGAWRTAEAVLPERLGGSWARDKKLAVSQQRQAERFAGVGKEKAEVDKMDRARQKAQIESYIKNPPTSERGKDRAAALFESMMGDKRLQKELGKDTVQKLWESQGENYRQMAQGNASKTADLEAFERANLHFTKDPANPQQSLDRLLKDADDVKGLSADAWKDQDVLAHAEKIQTNYRNQDGTYMNAREAALAGHYGKDAKRNAVAQVDASTLRAPEDMERQMSLAVETGNTDSAQAVIDQMQARYTADGTSDQERQQMARSMDRMRNAMARQAQRGNTTAAEALSRFDTARGQMETAKGFGLPPVPEAGERPADYVRDNFAEAHPDRIKAAVGQVGAERTTATDRLSALQSELDSLTGAEQATKNQIAAKQQQIDAVKRRIESEVKPEVDKAFGDLRAARQLLSEAQSSGDTSEIELAQEAVAEAQTRYDSAKSSASSEMTNDTEIQQLTQEIETLTAQAAAAGNQEQAKQKRREFEEVRAKAERLRETQERLEKLRSERTA